MVLNGLLGFIKNASRSAFLGKETEEQEALRVAIKVMGLFQRFDDIERNHLARMWMQDTKYSEQGKTGIDHLNTLISSGKDTNMVIAANVLSNHSVFLAACAYTQGTDKVPHQWIQRMTQSNLLVAKNTAYDLIADFDLDHLLLSKEELAARRDAHPS